MYRLSLAVIGLVCAALVAGLLALRSQPLALAFAEWAVATFSGLRLEVQNPRLDVYGGTLNADELLLRGAADDGPPLVSLLDVAATWSLGNPATASLFSSTLEADSLSVFVSEQEGGASPAPTQWLSYLGWLPARLRLAQVHLITASANTWIFPLKSVRGDLLASGQYRATAAADYVGEPLEIALEILELQRGQAGVSARGIASFTAPDSGSHVNLDGSLQGTTEDFHYDVMLSGFYRDIREFLRGFEGGQDLAGALLLQGRLRGDALGLRLSDARFILDNLPEYGFEAEGDLTYRYTGESSIALTATGDLASVDYLVQWLDVDVAGLGRARSTLELSGSLDRPVVERFRLSTGNEAGLAVNIDGRLKLYETDDEQDTETNAVTIEAQGPSLDVLHKWLGDVPYDPGPWRASGRLSGNRHVVSLEELEVQAGSAETIQLQASGSVDQILLPAGEDQAFSASGIDLAIEAHAADSTAVGSALSLPLPPYHEIGARFHLAGDHTALALADGVIEVDTSDLHASVEDISARLHPGAAQPLAALQGNLQLALSDSAALSQYTHWQMPVLGPLRVTARLVQRDQLFRLEDILARIDSDRIDLELRGEVGDLATPSQVALDARFEGWDTRELLLTLLPGFDYREGLGSLSGRFRLGDEKGTWKMTGLSLASGTERTPMQASVSGEIRDLTGLPQVDLDASASFRETSLLDTLTTLPLSPLDIAVEVRSSDYGIRGTLRADLGKTLVNAYTVVAFDADAVHSLQFALDTPHLYLQDLFSVQPELLVANAAAAEVEPVAPLAAARQSPPGFPIEVAVTIGGISGDNSNVNSLSLRFKGADNRYTLEEFAADYGSGLAEVRGIIDLSAQPAAMSLAANASALQLSDILTDMGVKTDIRGTLTVNGGVTLTGDDPASLLGNLNGSVAMALEDAVVEGAAYDLLATDLLAWIYSGALTEESTYLDCTMAKFTLRQGVASTEDLFIESARMVASGRATFDLVKQEMDLRITPLSKSRTLQVPSEVRLKGPMSAPRAKVSAINAVADATSAALMLIPELTMKLFGINQPSEQAYRPCLAENPN